MNKCEICGIDYEPIIPSQKYCSNYCRDISKIPQWKRPKVYRISCPNCGKNFKTTDSRRIYCSKECGIKHRNDKKLKQTRKPPRKEVINGYMIYVDEIVDYPLEGRCARILKKGKFKRIELSEKILDRLDTLYYKRVGSEIKCNYVKRISDSGLSHYELMFYAKFSNIILFERIDDD